MTPTEEQEMHALAVQLEELTRGTGWEASRYGQIGATMRQLTEYCAVCDCKKSDRLVEQRQEQEPLNRVVGDRIYGNTIHDIYSDGLEGK